MPKIIPELKKRLIETGRKLLLTGEPKDFSLRSISSECGIAVGTVYNYFTGKDQLIVAVLIDDWNKVLDDMKKSAQKADSFSMGLSHVYDDFANFILKYSAVWKNFGKGPSSKEGVSSHHDVLMNELGEVLDTLIKSCNKEISKEEERIICELLLTAVLQKDIARDDFVEFVNKRI